MMQCWKGLTASHRDNSYLTTFNISFFCDRQIWIFFFILSHGGGDLTHLDAVMTNLKMTG